MAEKKETLKLLPTTHVASAVGLATWGSPLSVYMACRRQAEFESNPAAPEREYRAGLRGHASRLLGRKFYRARTATHAGGRLACLAGITDGVTEEGEVALLLRMPKPGVDMEAWRLALETRELPLAERIECSALSLLADWTIQVGVFYEGRLHIIEHKRHEKMESEVGAAVFAFYRAVGAGKVPAAGDKDRAAMKALYPRHTAGHLGWKSLTAEQRGKIEQWYLARDVRLDAEKAEAALEPHVLEVIKDASGIELAGLGHFIERIDYMNKEAAPHAGTYKEIAHIHLTKCISPKSAKALLDSKTPLTGARSLKVYAGKGKKPGALGGRIDTIEQAKRASAKIDEIRAANPGAGAPDFKLLGDLCAELEAFDKRAQEVVST